MWVHGTCANLRKVKYITILVWSLPVCHLFVSGDKMYVQFFGCIVAVACASHHKENEWRQQTMLSRENIISDVKSLQRKKDKKIFFSFYKNHNTFFFSFYKVKRSLEKCTFVMRWDGHGHLLLWEKYKMKRRATFFFSLKNEWNWKRQRHSARELYNLLALFFCLIFELIKVWRPFLLLVGL